MDKLVLVVLMISVLTGSGICLGQELESSTNSSEDQPVYVVPVDPYYDLCIGCSEWMLQHSYPRGARPEDWIPLKRKSNLDANLKFRKNEDVVNNQLPFTGTTYGSYLNLVRKRLTEEGYSQEEIDTYMGRLIGQMSPADNYLTTEEVDGDPEYQPRNPNIQYNEKVLNTETKTDPELPGPDNPSKVIVEEHYIIDSKGNIETIE